jgi:hypothetical protein
MYVNSNTSHSKSFVFKTRATHEIVVLTTELARALEAKLETGAGEFPSDRRFEVLLRNGKRNPNERHYFRNPNERQEGIRHLTGCMDNSTQRSTTPAMMCLRHLSENLRLSFHFSDNTGMPLILRCLCCNCNLCIQIVTMVSFLLLPRKKSPRSSRQCFNSKNCWRTNGILTCARWYLTVILASMSLITRSFVYRQPL